MYIFLHRHPNRQEASIREPEWTVLMEIIRDSLSEVDCLMTDATNGTSKNTQGNKGETVKYAEKLAKRRWKLKAGKNRKEKQAHTQKARITQRCQSGVKCLAAARQRKTPSSHVRPGVKMPPPLLPNFTHDKELKSSAEDSRLR